MKFIERNGGLTDSWRLEQGFAMVSLMIARMAGNKHAKMDDFLPKRDVDGSVDDVFNLLSSVSNGTKKPGNTDR